MDWHLQEEDQFIVIASDGVWEFLSNEQVTQIVYFVGKEYCSGLGCRLCCALLLKAAARFCLSEIS